MKEPVDHIVRPQLPWRDGAGITECGLNAAKAPTITREEFVARHKSLGQQRMAMLTCMTCYSTAQRWGAWEDDPRKAMERESSGNAAGGNLMLASFFAMSLSRLPRLSRPTPTSSPRWLRNDSSSANGSGGRRPSASLRPFGADYDFPRLTPVES